MEIATQHTYVLGTDALADRTINRNATSGLSQPLMVVGIVVTNTDGQASNYVTFYSNDGTTTLMTIAVGANTTVTQEAPWLADAGLVVEFDDDTVTSTMVTVLWRPGV